jgi:capsular exopolysaccharide synthesis family protein
MTTVTRLDSQSVSRPAARSIRIADTGGAGLAVDPERILRTLWERRWMVLAGTALAVGLAVLWLVRFADPVYTATASLALDAREDTIVDFQSVVSGLPGDASTVNTELEVLRSRGLAEKLVTRLDLMSDPEFNAALRPERSGYGAVPARVLGAVSAMLSPGAERMETPEVRHAATVNAVRAAFAISNQRGSMVFRVTARSGDPAKAARLANALADLYVLEQVAVKARATEAATDWLSARVPELRAEFDAAQAALRDFTATETLTTPEELALLNGQIGYLRGRIDAGEEGADSLRRSLLDLEAEIARKAEGLVALEALQAEVEQTRSMFDYFQTRLRETAVQQGIQRADSRVISAAVVPTRPTWPDPLLVLASAAAVGFVLSASAALALEAARDGFRNADELEDATGVTVLGELPRAGRGTRKRLLRRTAQNADSPYSEAVRALRTALAALPGRPGASGRGPQVLMVTSSLPGEGKSLLAVSLARSVAEQGRSVLLVECDLRLPVLGADLGLYDGGAAGRGLVSLLEGQNAPDFATVAQSSDLMPGVDVVAVERIARSNPANLLSSERFRDAVELARTSYDAILLDAPPVLPVTDSRVVANLADSVLFTVWWGRTPRSTVGEALRLLGASGHAPDALVLTQIDRRAMRQLGYGRYGGYGAAKRSG